ncbi:MAG: universal stress protein [Balneolaceae bacterium]
MNISDILVPIDFSELSTKALETAEKVAGLFQSRITPVHVHLPINEMDEPYALGMGGSGYQDYDELERVLKERLREVASEHVQEELLKEPIVLFGNPAQSISDLSESYDFVVMSTHGRTGFSRFFLGSVAEKVLRLAHVPVLIVEDESDVGNFEKILVTTDFSENAAAAFPYAKAFAQASGANVHLLHVLSYDQIEDSESEPSLKKIRKERLKLTAKESFHDLEEKITYSVLTSEDSPHEAIFKHLREETYNLVIMATVGRTGIRYLMMGSTTANVARHVDTAVLSVNPKKEKTSESSQ